MREYHLAICFTQLSRIYRSSQRVESLNSPAVTTTVLPSLRVVMSTPQVVVATESMDADLMTQAIDISSLKSVQMMEVESDSSNSAR